jgi:hypothetical protein
MLQLIHILDPTNDKLKNLYTQNHKFVNYAFVCGGIGVAVNQAVLHGLVTFLPLYLANFGAIAAAMVTNYTLTVGPLGYIFGLSEKKEKKEK